MRALILTGPETEEQRGVAQAVKAALAARGGSSLTVGAFALLGPHAPLSLTGALEREALKTPRAFSFLTAGGAFQRAQKRKSTVYEVNAKYAENLRTLLAEGDFDAVLCLHRYPAEAVAYFRKTLAFSARCCFVGADFSCVPFLEETGLDLVFTAHESLSDAYRKRGISERKILPAGIPLPAAWFRDEERADARTLLALPQGVPCYFIHSADDPAAAVSALLDQLNGANARVCALTPEAVLPRNPFSARFAGEIRVIAVAPDDPVPLYRNACDVLLSAPSGAVSAAAAVAGVPLVHLPPRDDFEAQTARFFSARGMSVAVETLSRAADEAIALVKNPAAKGAMLTAQRGVCRADAAERIVRFLHEGKLE
jgi:hypothetical protein